MDLNLGSIIKLRTRKPHQRQEVTGIVVNKKLQAPKDYRKKFRQEVYYIKKFGFDDHVDFTQQKRRKYLLHLIGKGNFILFVNPKDASTREGILYLKGLHKEMLI